jgi:hypothetical protein
MRSVSAAPITTKPFYMVVGPFERALETRLPCFGGGKYGAVELAKCDGALTREKPIHFWICICSYLLPKDWVTVN